MYKTRQSSETPLKDILTIAYEGQPETSRQYESGFESFMNQLPVMDNNNTDITLPITQTVMKRLSYSLSNEIENDRRPLLSELPDDGKFHRTIIGIESPKLINTITTPNYKEGAELVLAKWGKGFKSPVHGHSTGYMHEEVLKGKIRVNTYRIIDMEKKITRPYKTEIIGPGVFVSGYAPHDSSHKYKRQTLIHNFVAIEPSISLHYLPEHTRDGRDNGFEVQHFSHTDHYHMSSSSTVDRISSREGMYLKPGEVLLVRSTNVPEYGDHFIVVTGPPIMKEHGMRIQDVSIEASFLDSQLLDTFVPETGLVLLKLKPEIRDKFLSFHDIKVENNKVLFPII